MNEEEKREAVIRRYGAHAKGERPLKAGGLLDAEGCIRTRCLGYTDEDLAGIPEAAEMGLGCGVPLSFLLLKEGETVLDLGCGGGMDCFIAAKRVGKRGTVIGIDLTPEMVERARKNAVEGGFANVEFILGAAEDLPLPDHSIDSIISNCVLNLVADKAKAFAEAARVLRPGGRICLSDIVTIGRTPHRLRHSVKAYTDCLSGAVPKGEYLFLLAQAGFRDITVAGEEEWPFFHNLVSIQVTACLK